MSAETDDFGALKFTGSEVIEALGSLPEELAEGVLQRLKEINTDRIDQEQSKRTYFVISELAIAAHQNVIDTNSTPGGLDVINWNRLTDDTSAAFVRLLGTLTEQQRESIPPSVTDWALYRYIKHELTAEEPEVLIDESLQSVGVTVNTVYLRCLDLMVELKPFGDKSLEQLKAQMPDPYNFAYDLIYSANEFDQQLEQRMRDALIQAGYTLPELEPDNTYGVDDDESYKMPVVDESMFPAA
ncbi:MAG TPA: hypothetical protein VIH90_02135 [Candidatus Saccharimonadales bacterium]